MSSPVVWVPRSDAGPLQSGQEWSPLEHGGPHHGTLSRRERRAYRFTFGLLLWVQALFLITMWALRFVYAGTESPIGLVFGILGGVGVLVMVHAIGAAYAAAIAARADDQRRAGRLALLLLVAGAIVLACIAVDTAWLGYAGSSRLGEIWYLTNGIFAAQLLGTMVAVLAASLAARRGRSGEFAFDALRMQWMYLAVAFTVTFIVDYAL